MVHLMHAELLEDSTHLHVKHSQIVRYINTERISMFKCNFYLIIQQFY